MEEVKDVFDLELKACGKCSMGVESDSKDKKAKFYVNPLIGGVSGTVKMPAANWDIADFKYEFNITDRYQW